MQIEQFKTDIIPLRQKLFLFARKYLQNGEDAKDAVQETLLRLWKIRDQLDNVSSPGTFSMQTLKNICIDRLRTAKEHTEINDFHPVANSDTPLFNDGKKGYHCFGEENY